MDLNKLRQLIDNGHTMSELIQILGTSKYLINKAAKELGLKITSARNFINIDNLRSEVSNGMSFSKYSKKYNYPLSAVSRCAAANGIKPPGINHVAKDLPNDTIYSQYKNGASLDSLSKIYCASIATIKRHIKKHDKDIVFRTYDEAIRPNVLNDRTTLEHLCSNKSCRSIAKDLGVKTKTVTNAAKRFGIELRFFKIWNQIEYSKLFQLYIIDKKTPSQIANELGYTYGTIRRQLNNCGFPCGKIGGSSKPSKYSQLNDKEWLFREYSSRSANDIAIEVGCSVSVVIYHLCRHGINLKSKQEWLDTLLNNIHGIRTTFNGFVCDSQLEVKFLRSLKQSDVVKRNVCLQYGNSYCYIDFEVNGDLVEVKPKNQINDFGPVRRRMIKQAMICRKNNRNLAVWSDDGVWDGAILDDDIYYASDWKLFFDSVDECFNWLIKYGFKPPQYSDLELCDFSTRATNCKIGHELNADYSNVSFKKLTWHFFRHYWYSTHLDYIPISAAWESGNLNVLKRAVNDLWSGGKEVNIHGLLKHINKAYKDFSVVSLFKPWVAKHIYNKYIPNGGTVIDPCCGWGGRFLGTIDRSDIKYVGYDLNKFTIDSHIELREFLGSNVSVEPEFINADSSVADFKDGDLLFTSPPYDDVELYHGIDSNKTVTLPILMNIFRHDFKFIIINLSKKLSGLCISTANGFGYKLVETIEMKTSSFMGRVKTSEPIMVFSKS